MKATILTLPNSPLKAEAQYRIGEAIEQQIKINVANNPMQKADFSSAMVAFKRCAEAYPESAYAGDSFKKVIDYYISIRDYARCVETLERVFQDYPDAPWLDEMLLKWGVVLYRQGNRPAAIEKFQRLVEEYPGGQAERHQDVGKLEHRVSQRKHKPRRGGGIHRNDGTKFLFLHTRTSLPVVFGIKAGLLAHLYILQNRAKNVKYTQPPGRGISQADAGLS